MKYGNKQNNYFKKFKVFVSDYGYEGGWHPANHYFIKTTNGIKQELKFIGGKPYILCAYGKSEEILNALKETFLTNGYKIITNSDFAKKMKKRVVADHKCVVIEYRNMDQFVSISKIIEDIDTILKTRKHGLQLFKNEYSPLKIGKRYIFAIENEDQHLLDFHREILSADHFKNLLAVNEETEERSYCEHVVPCIMIHNECIRMAKAGESATAIGKFVEANLKIAYIRPEDADKLNTTLGLKTTMPKGWIWGANIFARLDENNIKY